MNKYLSIITLNVNGLNAPIKRPRIAEWIRKHGRIHQEDKNIVNIYTPNIGEPKYIKKILEDFQKEIDSNTIIIGDFNTPLSKMDRSSKQNIQKDIVSLNNTLELRTKMAA